MGDKETIGGSAVRSDASTSRHPSRFAWGVALGVGIGAVTVVVVIALAAIFIYSRMMAQFSGMTDKKVEVVQSSEPWLKMIDKTHGRIDGFLGAGGSSGSRMPYGSIYQFDLEKPTQQNGVRAAISVSIYVTPKTKLTLDGKPWKPRSRAGKTPAMTVFGGLEGPEDAFLGTNKLTVNFRREGRDLVAEHIDASKTEKKPNWRSF